MLPVQTAGVSQRPGVADPLHAAALVRLLRAWASACGLAIALMTLSRLGPPLVGILATVGLAVVAAVLYVRTVLPFVRGRRWGLMSFLPVAHRLRYLGCVGPASVLWLWLFQADYSGAIGRPGGLVLAAIVIAVGMTAGAWWSTSGLLTAPLPSGHRSPGSSSG